MTYLTVRLLKESRVLLLEDSPMRIAWFQKRIHPKWLTVAKTVQEFKAHLETKPICDYLFLDHDLGAEAGNGAEAAEFIKQRFGNNNNAGLIHTWNSIGARTMMEFLPKFPWVPFGDFEVEIVE